MKFRLLSLAFAVVLPVCLANLASADNQWLGGNGVPLNHWDEPSNWDSGMVPQSATERHIDPNAMDDLNVARFTKNGTVTLVDSSVNATTFGLQLGHPLDPALPSPFNNQSASNTLNMTGGSITNQGGFGFNVGRGTNNDPNHLVQFNMSGGTVNASILTVPEAFGPPAGSVGINAEMHVSGNSKINTDLLRLGAQDANSTVTLSGNALVRLNDDNNGFSPGVLWIEAFEDPNNTGGTSLLEISDNAQLRVFGEWWTDGNGNGQRDVNLTEEEYDYFVDNYVSNGWIAAGSGFTLHHEFVPTGTSPVFDPNTGSPTGATVPTGYALFATVPEPTTMGLVMMAAGSWLILRRKEEVVS